MRRIQYLTARTLDVSANVWRDLTELIPSLSSRYCFADNNGDYRSCVLLAGGGRSGTTWLANVINYDNSYRFMFEPFYNLRVAEWRGFLDQQYLPPDNNDDTYLRAAEKILSGQIRNRWVDSHNRKLKVTKRLVKDIRVNLLLGWIKSHFPEIPIILMMRHPCGVAHSRNLTRWPADLDRLFLSQPKLVDDFLAPHRRDIENAKSDFERQIFLWCIQNYVPLLQFNPGEILVTTYEDCVVNPQAEIPRIFEFLQQPFHSDVFAALKKPSSQARYNWRTGKASAVIVGESIVDSWTRSIRRSDVERAVEILHLFGLDAIYGTDPMPFAGSAETFLHVHAELARTFRPVMQTAAPHRT